MSVQLKKVSFQYLHAQVNALNDITLEIKPGSTVGLIGRVGAGKSSLLRMLNGLIPHEFPGKFGGQVLVEGLDTRNHEVKDLARHVGLVLDNPSTQIIASTVEDDVNFGPSNIGMHGQERIESVDFALKETRLDSLRHRNPEELSGGQQQSLVIAGMMAMKPAILGLDEPFAMLDPIGKRHVLSVMKQVAQDHRLTTIIAESGIDLDFIIGYLDRGQVLLDDTPRRAITSDILSATGVGYPEIVDLFLQLKRDHPKLTIPITLDEAASYLQEAMTPRGHIPKPMEDSVSASPSRETPKEARPPLIAVRNLVYAYENGVEALKGISFDVFEGEMIGLIGQNGSGKTTLSFNLVGLYKPTSPLSQVYVDGLDVRTHTIKQVIQHINYVFQDTSDQLFCPTVWEEISFGPRIAGWNAEKITEHCWDSIKLFGLDASVNQNIYHLTKELRTFTAISSIVALHPKILIIDEPTTGMDRTSADEAMRALHRLKDQGRTIIIITHNMRLVAEHCDRTIALKDGRILLDGPTHQVFANPDILGKAFLTPPQIVQLAQRLKGFEIPRDVITVPKMAEYLRPRLKKEENRRANMA